MEIIKTVRQGDVLLQKVKKSTLNQSKLAKGKTLNKLTVALGEVTGHHHTLFGLGEAKVKDRTEESNQAPNDVASMFFEVEGGNAILRHDEHDPIMLDETGEDEIWMRTIQIEYNPFEKIRQRVAD